MAKRIFFGFVMIAAVGALLALDWWLEQALARDLSAAGCARPPRRPLLGLPIAAALLAITAIGFIEIARLAAANRAGVLLVSGLIGSVMLATLPYWWQFLGLTGEASGIEVLAVLAIIVLGVFAEQMIRYRTEDSLRRIACTLLAVVYLGVGGAFLLAIRLDPSFGVPMLVLFLTAVKLADMGAYFVGSAAGRHKLVGWLSPGKSWEGLAGGLAAAAGVSVALAWGLKMRIALWQAAAFGVAVGLVGQFADLCESLLKRSADLKDSGAVVPQFGGVLDIMDSLLLAAPIGYLLLGLAV